MAAAVALMAWQMVSQPVQAKDMTDLSLEQLMHLDVIQLSVPGAHFHYQGDWMIGYDYSSSQYGGYLSGTSSVSNNQVLSQYMMANTRMQSEMEDLMLMYGLRDNWTINVMIPYMNMTMDQVMTSASIPGEHIGGLNSNHTAGLGDMYVGVIHPFRYKYPTQWQWEAGLGLPTGNIDQFGLMTGMFGPQKLPYDMQLGSGSFTFQPSLTYLGETDKASWGGQLRGYLPLDQNWDHYIQSNRFSATGWYAPQLSKHFSPSVRVDFVSQGNIRGADNGMDPTTMPDSNPGLYAGRRADIYLGLNFNLNNDGQGHGQWISIEGGWPFYQSLTGPQLKLNNVYSAAFEWTFK
jgi:hypothetical protein